MVPRSLTRELTGFEPGDRAVGVNEILAAPVTLEAFSRAVVAGDPELIAVAVAHVTQCPYCIRGHAKAARRSGASAAEIMEAIWVAAEMRAGGAFAHSALALDAIDPET